MSKDEDATQHDEAEAQRRFERLVRTALSTPPKPLKDVPRKRPAPPPKRRPKAAKPSARAAG